MKYLRKKILEQYKQCELEITSLHKELLSEILQIYKDIQICEKSLKEEGLVVNGKPNPHFSMKMTLLGQFKSYIQLMSLDIKTFNEILLEVEIQKELEQNLGIDDSTVKIQVID